MNELKNKILAELNKRDCSTMTIDELNKAAAIYSILNAYDSYEFVHEIIDRYMPPCGIGTADGCSKDDFVLGLA